MTKLNREHEASIIRSNEALKESNDNLVKKNNELRLESDCTLMDLSQRVTSLVGQLEEKCKEVEELKSLLKDGKGFMDRMRRAGL